MADKKAKGTSTEVHVTEVFGIPIVRKYVESYEDGKNRSEPCRQFLKVLHNMKLMMIVSTLISATISFCILYYPPPILLELKDSLLINYLGSADLEELQKNLRMREAETTALKDSLGKCIDRELKLSASFERAKGNFTRSLGEKEKELETAIGNLALTKGDLGKSEEAYRAMENQLQMNLTKSHELRVIVEKELSLANKMILLLEENEKEANSSLEEARAREENQKKQLQLANQRNDQLEENHQTTIQEMTQCQENKNRLEYESNAFKKDLQECQKSEKNLKKRISDVTAEKVSLSTKIKNIELNNSDLQLKLEKSKQELKKRTGNFEMRLGEEKKEKLAITAKFDASEFKLGECRNKNMDHEDTNAKLLEEIEGLKKEIKKC